MSNELIQVNEEKANALLGRMSEVFSALKAETEKFADVVQQANSETKNSNQTFTSLGSVMEKELTSIESLIKAQNQLAEDIRSYVRKTQESDDSSALDNALRNAD